MAESEYTPTLTLHPTEAAVQEAPAAPQLVVEKEEKKPSDPGKEENPVFPFFAACAIVSHKHGLSSDRIPGQEKLRHELV